MMSTCRGLHQCKLPAHSTIERLLDTRHNVSCDLARKVAGSPKLTWSNVVLAPFMADGRLWSCSHLSSRHSAPKPKTASYQALFNRPEVATPDWFR